MMVRVSDEVQSKELPEQGEATDVPNRVFTLLNLFPVLVPREGIIVYDLSSYHLLDHLQKQNQSTTAVKGPAC